MGNANSLDKLAVEVQAFDYEGHTVIAAALKINDLDFIELVRRHERPFADAEGSPDIAGAYGYLPAKQVLPPATTLLGTTGEIRRVALLQCTCGDPGCWPLCASIAFGKDVVVWRDFEQLHRRPSSAGPVWEYTDFGPFRFDRAGYDAVLAQAGSMGAI